MSTMWWNGRCRRALAGILALCVLGCDVDSASMLQVRYAGERWTHRAHLRRAEALWQEGEAARALWEDAAWFYGRAIEALPPLAGRGRPRTPLEAELARQVNEAVLGHIEASRHVGRSDHALTWARLLRSHSDRWPGTRGRAALEIARCHDDAGRWDEALRAYRIWCAGLRDGHWSLHRSELEVPQYVSRRLGDRGQFAERRAWVKLTDAALEAAAARGELAREARYARFLLLQHAEHWDAALAALRRTRQLHDPQGQDGGLMLAEANLLAGALEKPDEAMGLLLGLYSEASQHVVQYRVAALLLAGRIQAQRGGLDAAQEHYEHALFLARSSMGRAEATLGLARVHTARGEVEQASRDYTRLRTSWPSTAAGLLGSLEEYGLLKRHGMDLEATAVLSQAMDHYRTVIASFGTELPALRAAGYLSEVLGRSGSWEQGVTFLDSIAATFSEDPRAGSLLLRAARIAADELEDPRRAQGLLRRVSQRYPDSDLAIAIRPFADSLQATLEVP